MNETQQQKQPKAGTGSLEATESGFPVLQEQAPEAVTTSDWKRKIIILSGTILLIEVVPVVFAIATNEEGALMACCDHVVESDGDTTAGLYVYLGFILLEAIPVLWLQIPLSLFNPVIGGAVAVMLLGSDSRSLAFGMWAVEAMAVVLEQYALYLTPCPKVWCFSGNAIRATIMILAGIVSGFFLLVVLIIMAQTARAGGICVIDGEQRSFIEELENGLEPSCDECGNTDPCEICSVNGTICWIPF